MEIAPTVPAQRLHKRWFQKGKRKELVIMPTKSNNTGGRGGRRPGAGRKKKAVQEKAANGNPGGKPLKVLDIPDMEGVEMP